jgi:hypothetical protein
MNPSTLPRVLAALFFLLVPFLASAANAPDLTGRVVFVDGDVTANGRVIDTGDVLAGATVLKTGKASTVEVVFGGRNVFRLGSDTLVKIDFAALQKTVDLQQGVFTSVLKKLGQVTGGSPAFLLRTPTVAAGVRGTSFHVSVEGDRTYFCTCNGAVTLDDGTPAQLVDLTNAHHGARIFTKQPDGSITVVPAGLEGHTDASIETLARRIGVTVDWTKPDLKHE